MDRKAKVTMIGTADGYDELAKEIESENASKNHNWADRSSRLRSPDAYVEDEILLTGDPAQCRRLLMRPRSSLCWDRGQISRLIERT
jgi:hypothetical protein